MKAKQAILTTFLTIGSVITFRWLMDKKSLPKLSNSTVVSTDPSGSEIIEVTGVGGVDAGKTVQGYRLPDKLSDVTFPLDVIVVPNQTLFGILTYGKTATVSNRNDMILWYVNSGDAPGDYLTSYDELKQKALKAVS